MRGKVFFVYNSSSDSIAYSLYYYICVCDFMPPWSESSRDDHSVICFCLLLGGSILASSMAVGDCNVHFFWSRPLSPHLLPCLSFSWSLLLLSFGHFLSFFLSLLSSSLFLSLSLSWSPFMLFLLLLAWSPLRSRSRSSHPSLSVSSIFSSFSFLVLLSLLASSVSLSFSIFLSFSHFLR